MINSDSPQPPQDDHSPARARPVHNLGIRATYDPVTRTLPEDVPQVFGLMSEDRPRARRDLGGHTP